MKGFDAAVDGRVLGAPHRFATGARERERVAYHEAGHAIVASVVPGVDPVQRISIAQKGPVALGYTLQAPSGETGVSREALVNQLTVLLGGPSAEEIVFGEISAGAQNDLQRASDLARAISGDGAPPQDADLRTMLVAAHGRAADILRVRRDALQALALALIERNVVERAELRVLLERHRGKIP